MPAPALALAAVAAVFFALPIVGLLWRLPWGRLGTVLSAPEIRSAMLLSLRTSLAAAGLSLLFGVPLAWLLARAQVPGKGLLRALCALSMVLPPVVSGVVLFFSFGRRGLFGSWLYQWLGLRLPYSAAGVVVAQTFVAMPFLVLTVEAALRQQDERLEDAARSLGASRWMVFRRVTLPAVRPALTAGAVLAWGRALGEFGATITFAGNAPGRTQTMPLAIYLALESDPGAALVMSLLMVAVSLAILLGLRQHWLGEGRRP